MSISRDDATQSNADALIVRLQELINLIDANANIQSNGNAQVNSEVLEAAEKHLNDILPMLQFEQMDAEDMENWEQTDKLDQAIDECKTTLNFVRAASLRTTVIGLNSQDIAEMQKIRQEIDAAAKTQGRIEIFLNVVNFLRGLASRII